MIRYRPAYPHVREARVRVREYTTFEKKKK